jgi:protein-S-isoprenylcysteine O-methyltransferase Ste14
VNQLAAVFWGIVLGLRVRQVVDGNLMAVLLAMQAALVAFRLVDRRSPITEASLGWRIFAWSAAILPLAFMPGGQERIPVWLGQIFAAAGLILSLWAIVSLGDAFGIAPADRGLVSRGPYKILRHPTYAGELLNFIAYSLVNASVWNVALTAILAAGLVARILIEERQIGGYPEYAQRVRWRVLYGLW